jgi:hypothetical protein
MKTIMNYTRILVIAFVAVFTLSLATPAMANDGKNPTPTELKYIGEIKNQPVFELTFNTEDESEFIVVIRDEYRNVLHKEFVKAGTASKKYLITNELADLDLLQFEVTGRKTDKTVVFQINKNARFVQDVVVNKIK